MRANRVRYEVDAHVLDIRVRHATHVANQVEWHAIHTGDFGELEPSGLQKLAVIRRNTDLLEGNPFLKYGHSVGVIESAMRAFPGRPQALPGIVAEFASRTQKAARRGIVSEIMAREGLQGEGETHRFPLVGDGRQSPYAIDAQVLDVENLFGREDCHSARIERIPVFELIRNL